MAEQFGWTTTYVLYGIALFFGLLGCALWLATWIWDHVRDCLIRRWFPDLYDAAYHHRVRSRRNGRDIKRSFQGA